MGQIADQYLLEWTESCGYITFAKPNGLIIYASADIAFFARSFSMFCETSSDGAYFITLHKEDFIHYREQARKYDCKFLYFICVTHPEAGLQKLVVPGAWAAMQFSKCDSVVIPLDERIRSGLPGILMLQSMREEQ